MPTPPNAPTGPPRLATPSPSQEPELPYAQGDFTYPSSAHPLPTTNPVVGISTAARLKDALGGANPAAPFRLTDVTHSGNCTTAAMECVGFREPSKECLIKPPEPRRPRHRQ